MSDRLADILVAAARGIVAHVDSAAGAATKPAPVGGASTAAKPAPATKPAPAPAGKPAPATKPAPAGKPAAPAGKPAAKPAAAPKSKHDQKAVIEILKRVLHAPGLGKESVKEILVETADGVTQLSAIAPQNFDATYEAAENLLNSGEGSAPVDDEDDLDGGEGAVAQDDEVV